MVHKLPLQKENVTDMDSTAPLLSWSVRRKIFFFLTICLPNSLPYVLCFAPPFFFSYTLLLSGSFHPVASAAIGRFKWLLTGSTGDLWLHLSLPWNPLPSGLFSSSPSHSIIFPFYCTFRPSSLFLVSLVWRNIFFYWLFFYLDIFFICLSIFLMHLSLCFCLQNKLRTGG